MRYVFMLLLGTITLTAYGQTARDKAAAQKEADANAYPTEHIEETTYNTEPMSVSLFELKILVRLFNRNYNE